MIPINIKYAVGSILIKCLLKEQSHGFGFMTTKSLNKISTMKKETKYFITGEYSFKHIS